MYHRGFDHGRIKPCIWGWTGGGTPTHVVPLTISATQIRADGHRARRRQECQSKRHVGSSVIRNIGAVIRISRRTCREALDKVASAPVCREHRYTWYTGRHRRVICLEKAYGIVCNYV